MQLFRSKLIFEDPDLKGIYWRSFKELSLSTYIIFLLICIELLIITIFFKAVAICFILASVITVIIIALDNIIIIFASNNGRRLAKNEKLALIESEHVYFKKNIKFRNECPICKNVITLREWFKRSIQELDIERMELEDLAFLFDMSPRLIPCNSCYKDSKSLFDEFKDQIKEAF